MGPVKRPLPQINMPHVFNLINLLIGGSGAHVDQYRLIRNQERCPKLDQAQFPSPAYLKEPHQVYSQRNSSC